MNLKYQIDTLDELSDEHKALYVEKDGKFVLNIEGLPVEDTAGLKSALERERANAAKFKKEIAKLEALGVNVDDIRTIIEEKEALETKKLTDKGDFEKILNQHKDKWAGEKQTLESERDQARTALRNYVARTEITTELVKAGVTEEGVALLPDSLVRRIRVTIEGDKPSIEVLALDGETLMAGTAKDGRATLGDLVSESVKTFPSLFKAQGKGGGGKPPGSGDGGKPGLKFNQMTGAELKTLREKDPQEYERLRAEHYGQRS
jgi:DNA-binding transcriptional MerR regulator